MQILYAPLHRFVDLFELVLKSQCGIDINKYCDNKKKGKTYVRQWSAEKLKGTDIFRLWTGVSWHI